MRLTAPPPTSCGTASLRQPGQALRHLARTLLPGVPVVVGNRAVPDPPAPAGDGAARELAAVVQAVARETIDWAVALGARHLARAAERQVPGVSAPLVVYNLAASLCHARRGDLIRALQTLPLTAVLPASLLQDVARQLQPLLAEGVGDGVEHEPVVLAAAVLALAWVLHRDGVDEPPSSAAGRSLVGLLRGLRLLLGVRAGLCEVLHRRPPRHPALAQRQDGPSRRPAGLALAPTTALERAFPSASRALALPSAGVSAAMAWPFAGADARRRGGATSAAKATGGATAKAGGGASARAGGGASGKGGAAHAPSANGAGRRTHRFTLSRRTTTESEAGVDGSRSGAGGWASGPRRAAELAVQAAPQTAKESTAVAKSRGDGQQSASAARREEVAGGNVAERAEAVHATDQARGVQPWPDARVSAAPVPAGGGGAADEYEGEAMAAGLSDCLRFHPARSPVAQLAKTRFLRVDTDFCVRGNETALFEAALTADGQTEGDAVYWMQSTAVRRALAPRLRTRQIRKYSGVGQLRRAESRDALPIGDDEIYSVLSISVLPDRAVRHHPVDDSQILEKNSFRLMRVAGLDGAPRLFIAYFLNRAAEVCRGVKAGFMEIQTSADTPFSLTDDNGGWTFSSDSLPDFIIGIERLSGCRYLSADGGGDALPAVTSLPAARSLFVREPATWCGKDDYDVQTLNEAMPLFTLRRLQLATRSRHVDLYRQSFMLLEDRMIYSDVEGRLHTVPLAREGGGQDACVLGHPDGAAARFLDAMGLRAGGRYQTLALVEQLESNGWTWMPTPPPLRAAAHAT